MDLPEPEGPVMRVMGEDLIWSRSDGVIVVVWCVFGLWAGWRAKGRRALID